MWLKGTVKNRLGERKYEVLTDSDRVIMRSRRHLKGKEHALEELVKFQRDSVIHRKLHPYIETLFVC